MTIRTYTSPSAFKRALEDRLRRAQPIGNLQRERQWLVFTRFLARIVHIFGDRVVVKGGIAAWDAGASLWR
ncbi:MAG TPA: hypothetical protein VGM88_07840 [Kofleriaceae bacterium]|jgi:hypothetical protein